MSDGSYRSSSIRYVSSEIERMADSLDLSEQVAKMGLRIFHQSLESEYEPPSLDAIAPACLYLGSLVISQGTTLSDVAKVSRRDQGNLQTISRNLKQELDLPGVKIQTPEDIVEAKCESLGIEEYKGGLMDLLAKVDDHYKGSKSPSSVAAAIMYLGRNIFNYDPTQEDIAETLNVTTVTIRNHFPDIINNSDITPPKNQRQFVSFDKAITELKQDLELPDQVIERVEARITLQKDEFANEVSKAGVVLAAILVTLKEQDGFEAMANAEKLSQYADVTPQTIERHSEQFQL